MAEGTEDPIMAFYQTHNTKNRRWFQEFAERGANASIGTDSFADKELTRFDLLARNKTINDREYKGEARALRDAKSDSVKYYEAFPHFVVFCESARL